MYIYIYIYILICMYDVGTCVLYTLFNEVGFLSLFVGYAYVAKHARDLCILLFD